MECLPLISKDSKQKRSLVFTVHSGKFSGSWTFGVLERSATEVLRKSPRAVLRPIELEDSATVSVGGDTLIVCSVEVNILIKLKC